MCKISYFISEFHNQRILNHEWWWLLGGEVLRNIYSILHVFQQEFTNRSDQSLTIQIHIVLIRKFKHEFWASFFRVKSLHKKPGSHTFRNTKFWFFVNYSRSDYISSHSRPSKRLYGCRHRKKSCQRETPFSDILYEDELLKDLTLESELMEVISG